MSEEIIIAEFCDVCQGHKKPVPPTQAEIADAAYYLWLNWKNGGRGKGSGNADSNWYLAIKQLAYQHSHDCELFIEVIVVVEEKP